MAGQGTRSARIGRGPLVLGVLVLAVAAGSVGVVRVVSSDADSGTCTAPVGTLTVGAAPTAVSWLSELAAAYSAQRRTVAGRCVVAEVRPLPLTAAEQALLPGAADPPDVWVPESTTSVALLRSRPEGARALAVPTPPVAVSPLVLAAPPDALRALSAVTPNNRPALLGDVLPLLRDPLGWGQPGLDRPEWGPIRFSTLDPGTTALGAGVLSALVGVLTGTPATEVGEAAYERPEAREGLLGISRAFATTPATAQELMAPVAQAGTVAEAVRTVGLVAAYEQDVWRHGTDRPAIVLAAGYPLGGQLAADFPYVVPNGSRPDAADRAAAEDFRGWLMSPAVQDGLQKYGLRRADGVAGPAVAQGLRTGSLDPLPAEPPVATDGPTAARTAWRLLARRISLLGVFDVSGSMAEEVPGTGRSKLDVARQAAQAALGYFDGRDSLGLWEFSRQLDGDKDYRVLVPLGPAGRPVNGYPDRFAASVAAYRGMAPRTATGLYDTVLAAYRSALASYRPDCVNTVVVISDGANEDSGSITLEELTARLTALYDPGRPVHVVALAYGTGADPGALAQLARATEGLQFSSPDPRTIGRVFVSAVAALAG